MAKIRRLAPSLPYLLFQELLAEPEGDGRFGGGAGLGNDADAEIHVLQEVQQVGMVGAAEIMTGKKDLGFAILQVVEAVAQGFDGRPGPQVRAANPDDHQSVGLPAYGFRRLSNRLCLGLCLFREVQPAQELGAGTSSVRQLSVGGSHCRLKVAQLMPAQEWSQPFGIEQNLGGHLQFPLRLSWTLRNYVLFRQTIPLAAPRGIAVTIMCGRDPTPSICTYAQAYSLTAEV